VAIIYVQYWNDAFEMPIQVGNPAPELVDETKLPVTDQHLFLWIASAIVSRVPQ
jgi:hypothetical protein